MPIFQYTVLDRITGEKRSDQLEAHSLTEAIAALESQGLVVQSIAQHEPENSENSAPIGKSTLQQMVEQSIERRETVIPVMEAFRAEIPKTVFRSRLDAFVSKLRGEPDSTELITQFPDWIPTLISIGHGASSTQAMINGLQHASQLSDQQSNRWRAITYPLIVLFIGLSVLIAALWFIVPEFTRMFREFAMIVPPPTRSLLCLSQTLIENPLSFFAGLASLVFAAGLLIWAIIHGWSFFGLFHLLAGRRRGKLAATAMLAADLAEMLRVGVPLGESLPLIAAGCDSPSLRPAIEDLADRIGEGNGAIPESSAASLLPDDILCALTCPTPNAPMLGQLASIYMDRFHAADRGPGGTLSQWSIAVVGVVIGWLIIALFAPVISLIDALT